MSFPTYPSYRESGIGWLREVPSHWEVSQSRRLFWLRKDRARPGDRQLTASQKHGIVYQDEFMQLEGQKVVQVIHGADILKHVEPNDFVISMRSFQGGLEWSDKSGCISSAYVMLAPSRGIEPSFFRYLFKSATYIQALQSTTNLVRDGQAMRFDNFAQVALPVVPRAEQLAIAALLDRETAKIDALVEEQRRLIELLKEKRQAVISHAVTKGLDPTVPMKDSGVEWLGDVPAHWEVMQMRHVITALSSGTSVNAIDVPANQDAVGVLKTSCVYSGRFEASENKTVVDDELDRVTCPVRKGCLIVSRMNTPDLVGAAGLVTGDHPNIYLPDRLWQVEFASIDVEFVDFWTSSALYRAQVRVACDGTSSSMQNLSQDKFFSFVLPLPPRHEQARIVSWLRQQLAGIDNLASQARKATGLLQERRAALISAAVTGKIDVRDAAIQQDRAA